MISIRYFENHIFPCVRCRAVGADHARFRAVQNGEKFVLKETLFPLPCESSREEHQALDGGVTFLEVFDSVIMDYSNHVAA